MVAAVLAILAVAGYWRLLHLGTPGLWLDEILGVGGIGPEHGPVYYAIMRATTRQLPNEILTRLPFALAGLAGVAGAFLAGRTASGPWLGIGAASAVAASPIHIYYSREARPYALLLLCAVGLAAVGAIAIGLRAPRFSLALVTAAVVGLLLPVALMLWIQHGISARYVLSALPALTILAAGPLAFLDRLDRPWTRDARWQLLAAGVLLFVLGDAHASARRAAYLEKADWRRVASIVLERSAPGDIVIVSNDWSEICLTYYLPKGASARRIVNVRESLDEAHRVAAASRRALIVSGGTHRNHRAARP